VRFRPGARLDPSQVEDVRGSGGGMGPIAVGGGGLGVVGLLIYLAIALLGGGSSSALSPLDGQTVSHETAQCRSGADANASEDCMIVGDINSIQSFWSQRISNYTISKTVFFTGSTDTGCGPATTDVGPFYCPADKKVYIDLTFYNDIQSEFNAADTPFVNAYVLAHEYGHHVQDLLGIEAKVRTRQGATSDSVRLELQADCFAGVWARHATEPGPNGEPALITDITAADFDSALKVAGRIGDDWIQKNLGGGQINQNAFTHGTSAQRQRWLTTGYRTGDPNACDTFGAADLG
jgi:predicted metalloprotease